MPEVQPYKNPPKKQTKTLISSDALNLRMSKLRLGEVPLLNPPSPRNPPPAPTSLLVVVLLWG